MFVVRIYVTMKYIILYYVSYIIYNIPYLVVLYLYLTFVRFDCSLWNWVTQYISVHVTVLDYFRPKMWESERYSTPSGAVWRPLSMTRSKKSRECSGER